MRSGPSKLVRLMRLAEEQQGLVTSRQAVLAGVSFAELSRMAGGGVLERVHRGVYRVGGAPGDRREDLRATWLSLDPAAAPGERLRDPVVLSHATAAVLHDLGDLAADVHEFTLTRRRQTRQRHVRLHRRAAAPSWTVVDGLPVTTVLQTIADLAAEPVDGGHLGGIVRDAVLRHLLPLEGLLPVLGRATRLYWGEPSDGLEFLQVLLHDAGGIPDTLCDIVDLMAGTAHWQPRAA